MGTDRIAYLGPAVCGDVPGVWDARAEHFTPLPADMADECCPQCYAGVTHTLRIWRVYHAPQVSR